MNPLRLLRIVPLSLITGVFLISLLIDVTKKQYKSDFEKYQNK